MNQASSTEPATSFRIRATFAPLTHLELLEFELQRFARELADKAEQAAMFFRETPLVISLERLADPDQTIDFPALLDICRRLDIRPIAVRGGNERQQQAARAAGLLLLPAGKPGSHREEIEPRSEPQQTAPAAEAAPPSVAPSGRPSKLIDHPIRSGQQVYAPGADLVVVAPVSPGAELLADGHIHVYAPLRGRALAGVLGDTSARIFCRSLEAELVSIAGQYKISEDLQRGSEWRQSVQIYLRDDRLVIAPI